jgi:hypothetical protein
VAIKLTDEDLAKLQDKQLANVLRKLNDGKTLTAREEAILARARTAGPAKLPPGTWQGVLFEPVATEGHGGYAKNWSELADALSKSGVPITRRAIQEWRHDPRYKADLPPDRADGRKDVAAWLAFMVKHGLKRADDHVAGSPSPSIPSSQSTDLDPDALPKVIMPPPIGGCAADWNKAGAMIDYERNKLKLETQRGTLLVASELEVPLGATFVVLSQKLSQFPERAAPQVVGFVDVNEVIGILRAEIEGDLGDLHGARYLDTTLDRILDELPFDAESTRLLQLVSFDGQPGADCAERKSALRELIARVALETLRTIGSRVIAEIHQGEPAPEKIPAAPADAIEEPAPQITPPTSHTSPQKPRAKKPARKRKPRAAD